MIGSLLKMAGVSVPPETVAQLEELLPQLPGKILETHAKINSTIKRADERIAVLEAQNKLLLQALAEIKQLLTK